MPEDKKKQAPQGGGMRGGRAAAQGRIRLDEDSGKNAIRMFSYIKGSNRVLFLLAMAAIFVAALVSVRSSTFIGELIDDHIVPLLLAGSRDLSGAVPAIVRMGTLYGISIAVTLAQTLMLAKVTHGVLKQIRDELFSHMERLPIRYFDSNAHGNIMSRYTNDIDAMRQMLSMSVPQVVQSVISVIVLFIAMVRISFRLTLVVLAMVAVMYVIVLAIGGRSASNYVLRQKSLGDINGYIEEMINGQKVVKVFCHEEEAKAAFDVKNRDLCEKTTKANVFANIILPIMGNLSNLQYALIAMIGGFIAISGGSDLTLGEISAFLLLSKNFSQPVSQISQQVNSVVMALAGAGRVFEMMDEPEEENTGRVHLVNAREAEDGTLSECEERTGVWAWKSVTPEGGTVLTKLRGDVRMADVDFGYVPEKTVLHDISLYAKPGQKIAFVGSTGAGKTTITNLLNRFYDVKDGSITYDGIDIKDIDKTDLRRSLGMVLQDTNLFTGTIKDNIRYGRLDATDEEVVAAAKLANAHGFIKRLPQGYDTVISGTGSQLSQGQCQLLAIARCAVADPPVMILDEATSSIDTRTESLVQQGMDKLMAGRTVFVIAHRLSTVQNSNAIMVLENGRIIERGDHDDLIAQKGRYYQLYTGGAAQA